MKDKILHFMAGFVISVIFSGVALWAGFGFAVSAGFLKEAFDYTDYGRFEYWDFVCTCIGGAFGLIPWILAGVTYFDLWRAL